MEETLKMEKVTIEQVLKDFKEGIERYATQNIGFGSIEEKYELTTEECRILFNHEQIKGRKVVNPLTGNKRKSKNLNLKYKHPILQKRITHH